MKIKLTTQSGVPRSEIDAHQKIQKIFTDSKFSKDWFGYASFKLARSGRGEGDDDFDLVLVTHNNVLVIELKIGMAAASNPMAASGTWMENREATHRSRSR